MANETTFNDFFSGQRVTRIANSEAVKAGVPRVVPDEFYRVGPTKPFNDMVQYVSATRNRSGAMVINRNSPPRTINLGNSQWKWATLFNMGEEWPIDGRMLEALLGGLPMSQANANAELAGQMMQFEERFDTTRTNMVNSMIRNGKVWIASDGQVATSSGSAVETFGDGFTTANQLTKDGTGSTYSLGDWSDPATDISKSLRDLQVAGVQRTRYPLTTILYGADVPSYLVKNKTVAPYFARNPQFNPQYVTNNEIPDGTLGFKWRPLRLGYNVSTATGNDGASTETVAAWFPSDFLFVCPDVTPAWYEFIEGGSVIPKGIWGPGMQIPNANNVNMFGDYWMIAYGKAGYGRLNESGPSMVIRDCCAPLIKVYGAVFAGRCATATA